MQTVRKVFNLLQLSKISQLTVSFALPEQEKCSLLRGKKRRRKNMDYLLTKRIDTHYAYGDIHATTSRF